MPMRLQRALKGGTSFVLLVVGLDWFVFMVFLSGRSPGVSLADRPRPTGELWWQQRWFVTNAAYPEMNTKSGIFFGWMKLFVSPGGDQLQATARPFNRIAATPDCTSTNALAFDKGPIFRPAEGHSKAFKEDVK